MVETFGGYIATYRCFESIKFSGMSKKLEKYERLYEQISHYVVTTPDRWARLATIEAVLHHKMQLFFWTGVYVLVEGELIVRSYQGPVACQKLRQHTGVCWAAVDSGKTVIVKNVAEFSGHIACNPATKSEIVLPLRDEKGQIYGCLDIDSDQLGAFDEEDEQGLLKILQLVDKEK